MQPEIMDELFSNVVDIENRTITECHDSRIFKAFHFRKPKRPERSCLRVGPCTLRGSAKVMDENNIDSGRRVRRFNKRNEAKIGRNGMVQPKFLPDEVEEMKDSVYGDEKSP
jgi:hypothetical protein